MSRRIGSQDDRSARLVDPLVIPLPHKMFCKFEAIEVPRQLQATAITSSRTRCNRMEDGGAESK
jgi:hypothetical protein